MNKFKEFKVGQLGDVVTGKTPKTNVIENYGDDYMFIGPTDLHKHYIISKSVKMISRIGLNSIKNNTIDGLSILVGCIGWDMGNVALVNDKCATNQQINSITNIKKEFNTHYIYYWFKGKKDFLFQISNVTRTPMLNKTDFCNIGIQIPSISNQNQIAKVLSDLDVKIEVNNKINQELEAMAKTLYDYWFVQFDFPDANGKPYKSSGGKMFKNEVLRRSIPEGWENGTIGDIAELTRGVTYSKIDIKTFNDEGVIPILRATNITGNVVDLENMVYVPDDLVSDNQVLNKYDIIITMSSGSKDHIGKNGFYYFENKVGFGAFCAKLVAKNNFRYYLYSYTQSDFMFETIKNESLGTNINNLNNSLVNGFQLVKPSCNIIDEFNSKVESSYMKIANNLQQNQKLSALRDWLLPMLMNGQVRVAHSHENGNFGEVEQESGTYK